jgi:cytochrome b involved in lipid metabolism
MAQSFAAGDVAQHNKPDSLWIIVDEDVYDVTKFQDEHPGGKKSMLSTSAQCHRTDPNDDYSPPTSSR